MAFLEFIEQKLFRSPDEVYFFSRVGGIVLEVDRNGEILPTEANYHAIQHKFVGTIKPFVGTRHSDGRVTIELNTTRKNIDGLKKNPPR